MSTFANGKAVYVSGLKKTAVEVGTDQGDDFSVTNPIQDCLSGSIWSSFWRLFHFSAISRIISPLPLEDLFRNTTKNTPGKYQCEPLQKYVRLDVVVFSSACIMFLFLQKKSVQSQCLRWFIWLRWILKKDNGLLFLILQLISLP